MSPGQMPGRQSGRLVFVVAQPDHGAGLLGHRLELQIGRRIVGGIAPENDQRGHRTRGQRGRELAEARNHRFGRLDQGHRGSDDPERRIDRGRQRMDRRRLGVTRHHQGALAGFLEVFDHGRNPSRMSTRRRGDPGNPEFGRDRGGDLDDLARLDPQAMVGVATGESHDRLHHVESVHPLIGGFATEGEAPDVAEGVLFGADEVAVERQDAAGLLEVDHGVDRGAAGLGVGGVGRAEIDRLVSMPSGLRILLGDELLKTGAGRGGGALREEREPLTLVAGSGLGHRGQRIAHGLDLGIVAAVGVTVGAVGIVKIQDRRLGERIGAAIAAGEERIALDLGRATVAGLDRQRNRTAPHGHRRGEVLGLAVDIPFGLLGERSQLLFRATATGGHATQARQEEARGHELHPVAATFAIGGDARAGRELTFHPLAEVGLVGQLLQGTPVFRTGLRFVADRGNRLHQRWQVEQLWPGWTFQS